MRPPCRPPSILQHERCTTRSGVSPECRPQQRPTASAAGQQALVFSASGQPLSGSFMDYGMPRSNSLPFLRRGSSRSCRRPTRLASRRAAKAITCRSAARPEPIRGAENAEIRCRIGAKSGAAFHRNHLPLSTEIRCRFAPIFADLRLERDQRAAAPQFAAVGVDQLIAKAEFQAHTPWHRLARQFSAKISKTQGVSKGKSALPQSFRRQFELAHTGFS
jgi:hypothetical protein